MHLKRQESPKRWPIERKGTAYLVKQNSSSTFGIPAIILLRDMLKLAQNRKEVKEAISSKKIFVNGRPIKDEKRSVLLFDVLSIPSIKKFYRLSLSERGKFMLEDEKESESHKKVSKVINKKMLKKKKIQLNLIDGLNFLSGVKCVVGDSVVVDFKKNTIEKCLPLEERAKVFVFDGKHSGKRGVITSIDKKDKMVEISDGKERINALIKQIIVTS